MSNIEKRRRRVELLIDQRLLGFLKPVATGLTLAPRKRDSLEFLSPLRTPDSPKHSDHKAS